uniref:Uncharacterized protein n=1 Tax=Arundo donax TaxID=35708 RepID=A0A0A9HWF3_ARUDO
MEDRFTKSRNANFTRYLILQTSFWKNVRRLEMTSAVEIPCEYLT